MQLIVERERGGCRIKYNLGFQRRSKFAAAAAIQLLNFMFCQAAAPAADGALARVGVCCNLQKSSLRSGFSDTQVTQPSCEFFSDNSAVIAGTRKRTASTDKLDQYDQEWSASLIGRGQR